jgi:hypothetical protein
VQHKQRIVIKGNGALCGRKCYNNNVYLSKRIVWYTHGIIEEGQTIQYIFKEFEFQLY